MALFDITEAGQDNTRSAAIGVDLGTTRSVVGYADGGVVQLLPDMDGNILIPSQILGVSSFKRLLGKGAGDAEVAAYVKAHGADVRGDDRLVTIETAQGPKNPIELSAALLMKLKEMAQHHLDHHTVSDAVITVPAYFNEVQRQATKDAAKLAGLNPLRLISEPTAAALAYGLDKQARGTYLVYDLGGGTFDVSLLTLSDGVFKVIATGGDSHLGGDDFDALIAEKCNMSLTAARQMKETLSEQVEDGCLTQASLLTLIRPLLNKTIFHVQDVLFDAEVNDVDGLILVGGSTRMPAVREVLREAFPEFTIYDDMNPDEVVARGAALQAQALSTGSAQALLLDVTPLSLGLETMGGLVEKIIARNTPVPITRAQVFTTFKDSQNAMDIHVLQGERETVAGCRSLAKFKLTGIPALPAGIARIQVTFMLDADGLLTVSAQEKTTGALQKVTVTPSYGMDETQMVTMLKESILHAKEDVNQRLLLEAQLELQQVIDACRQLLTAEAQHITPTDRTQYQRALDAAVAMLPAVDRDSVQQAQEALEQAFALLSEQRVNHALKQAVVGAKIS